MPEAPNVIPLKGVFLSIVSGCLLHLCVLSKSLKKTCFHSRHKAVAAVVAAVVGFC